MTSLVVKTWDTLLFVGSGGTQLKLSNQDAFLMRPFTRLQRMLLCLDFDTKSTTRTVEVGMPTARDASMWPSFLQNTWYCIAMTSDLMRVPEESLCSFDSPLSTAATGHSSCTRTETFDQDGGVNGGDITSRVSRSRFSTASLPLDPKGDRPGALTHSACELQFAAHATSQYGADRAAVGAAWNVHGGRRVCHVVCEHYGAVDKKHIVTVTHSRFFAVVPFIALMRLDDGAVWNDLVCNAWEGWHLSPCDGDRSHDSTL